MRLLSSLALSLCLVPLALTGCGDAGLAGTGIVGGGDLGATPGGAQDIGLARAKIDAGDVPRPEDFTVEGLYSEHDLALPPSAPCEKLLCVRSGAALARALDDGERDLFVQLGLSSRINLENFERKPLNLGVVVDASGSMSENFEGLKSALHALADAMRPDDRVALVVFEAAAKTVLASTPASDGAAIHAAVDALKIGGSTNMESGMRLGYEEIGAFVGEGSLSRLMVFTDAMPNVGASDTGSFRAMAQAAAARDIGLTFFGFGASFDAEFVDEISHLRGGNYRFVGPDDVRPIFEEELDFLVTPIAYDLRIDVSPREEAPLEAVYGVPRAGEHASGTLVDVTTVFLSRKKGGIVLRFDGAEAPALFEASEAGSGLPVGEVAISYATPEGARDEDKLAPRVPAESAPEEGEAIVPSPELARTLAVTNEYLVLERVTADFHEGGLDLEEADGLLDASIAELEAAGLALSDENLEREARMLEKLKANLRAGGGA